jgi:hypothetical protein
METDGLRERFDEIVQQELDTKTQLEYAKQEARELMKKLKNFD